jgi:hypothetical protein
MEQKIQRIRVCTTTKAADPNPKAKYTPIYFPTCGLPPYDALTSDQCFSHTLPPATMIS